jgi:hypothetical protein
LDVPGRATVTKSLCVGATCPEDKSRPLMVIIASRSGRAPYSFNSNIPPVWKELEMQKLARVLIVASLWSAIKPQHLPTGGNGDDDRHLGSRLERRVL